MRSTRQFCYRYQFHRIMRRRGRKGNFQNGFVCATAGSGIDARRIAAGRSFVGNAWYS
jgi:hypothetical protein